MAARVSLKAVNDELVRRRHRARLEKASGYFYFGSEDAADWIDLMVRVEKINALTLEQWVDGANARFSVLVWSFRAYRRSPFSEWRDSTWVNYASFPVPDFKFCFCRLAQWLILTFAVGCQCIPHPDVGAYIKIEWRGVKLVSADIERWDPPNDPTAFESLCLDLCQDMWRGSWQKNGRRGQPQAGVDIFGQHRRKWIGVQCKQKNSLLRHAVTTKELDDEVKAALGFKPRLHRFVLTTTGPRDVIVQERARKLTEKHKQRGLFQVQVWSWDDIWSELYGRFQLLERIAKDYWPRLALIAASGARRGPPRIFIPKLPTIEPTLIGREEQLDFLDRAWAGQDTNFVQVIAAGGTGKTALVDKWFRRQLGETMVFGWSFYSQGTSPDRNTSSDPFFAEIIQWLQIEIAPTASIYAKAEAVANRLREEHVLLLLDGVEPLQDSSGALRDPGLKALLQELATATRGLVLCTTRLHMDIPEDPPRVRSLDLNDLTPEQGAEYLRTLKVEGTDDELQYASRECWNHALALTLLGTYLVDFCEADVRRRIEIPELMVDDVAQCEHARRVISAYDRMFAGKPEGAILQSLGYFDRPAEPAALRLVRPKMDYRKYQAALKHLHAARLILTKDPARPLDCHPLVREYFAANATRDGHGLLYEHFKAQPPHRPDTLDEMTPLFHAIYHGCRADRHGEALLDIYRDRILRGGEYYLTKKLGAFGTELSLIANFFDTPWTQPNEMLSLAHQIWVRSEAGSALRACGQLAEAITMLRASSEAVVRQGDWTNAAIGYGTISAIHVALGNLHEAILAARLAVDCAGRSGHWFQKMSKCATLADAVHQSGDLAEASRLFAEAERIQKEGQPTVPILSSLAGYRYCDLLLDQGQTAEVLRRASKTLVMANSRRWLGDIGLNHLTLARAHPPGSVEAANHLDQAVDYLRRAGRLEDLPLALLTRGGHRDLDEVFRTATRSGMRLHLADYYLASSRLAFAGGDTAQAHIHFENAATLIHETGYHRRDSEIEKLRVELD